MLMSKSIFSEYNMLLLKKNISIESRWYCLCFFFFFLFFVFLFFFFFCDPLKIPCTSMLFRKFSILLICLFNSRTFEALFSTDLVAFFGENLSVPKI